MKPKIDNLGEVKGGEPAKVAQPVSNPGTSIPVSDRVLRPRKPVAPLEATLAPITPRLPVENMVSPKAAGNHVTQSGNHVTSSGKDVHVTSSVGLAPAIVPRSCGDTLRTNSDHKTPRDVWGSQLDGHARSSFLRVLDPEDLTFSAIRVYRANCGPLPKTTIAFKIVPNDLKTKPVSIPPPKNRKEAVVSQWWPGYYEAEVIEMESHEKNKTWILKPRSEVPRGAPVLRDRWAYDDKLAPGGTVIERFKARLTAMGCFQKEGIDYTDTYASVISTRGFRMLFQLLNSDASHHWITGMFRRPSFMY